MTQYRIARYCLHRIYRRVVMVVTVDRDTPDMLLAYDAFVRLGLEVPRYRG